jgi:hypothetical protein
MTRHHRQVITPLYINLDVDASLATPCHRPCRIVFTNIDSDTCPEYAPRHHHKVAQTSSMVIIADNYIHH